MKHRLLTFSIVVALFFALAIPAFAASKTLGVSEIDQNKTEWCWAACSEMIGKYYDSGSNRDQYDLVEYIKGNTDNQPGNTSNICAKFASTERPVRMNGVGSSVEAV